MPPRYIYYYRKSPLPVSSLTSFQFVTTRTREKEKKKKDSRFHIKILKKKENIICVVYSTGLYKRMVVQPSKSSFFFCRRDLRSSPKSRMNRTTQDPRIAHAAIFSMSLLHTQARRHRGRHFIESPYWEARER